MNKTIDSPPQGGEPVAVGMREASDKSFASESAQVVGGLASGVGPVQQGGRQSGELSVVEADQKVAEADGGRHDRHHPAVPEAQSGACRPSGVSDGQVTWSKVTTSGAGTASDAWASQRRWLAASPTARRAFQF